MKNKFGLILGSIAFIALSVFLAILSLRVQDRDQSQDLRSQAELGDDTVISISPVSADVLPGGTQSYEVLLTAGDYIGSISLAIDLSNNTDFSLQNFRFNSAEFNKGGWSVGIERILGNNRIEGTIFNNTIEGGEPRSYVLATFDVDSNHNQPANALLTFDMSPIAGNNTTNVLAKATGNDILLPPTSPASTINGVLPTATPTATPIPTATPTNTPSPTPTNTPIPTAVPTNTPTPTPTNTPVPTATNTPTPTATPVPGMLTVLFRLQGLTQPSARSDQSVTAMFYNNGGQLQGTVTGTATLGSDGIYTLTELLPTGMTGTNYDMVLKGTQHLARRFDTVNYVVNGANATVDISATSMPEVLIGDVNDDNAITLQDVTQILAVYINAFSVPVSAGAPEDLNRDGVVSITDVALALLNYDDFIVSGDN